MNSIQIIAFTHRQFNFDEIGLLHLEDDRRKKSLTKLKSILKVKELMYLSTCNRVEFIICGDHNITNEFIFLLIQEITLIEDENKLSYLANKAEVFSKNEAIQHLFSVASSLDSLVLGEREIITQVRKAFEECRSFGLCDDIIRILVQNTIQTAKKVYTESKIAIRPVSVVSLAYLELKKYLSADPKKIMVIGAGKTIVSMLKFLTKNHEHEFFIYNRSVENAIQLVDNLNLNANVYSLNSLGENSHDTSIIITCTGSKDPVLTNTIFSKINSSKKTIIVDLAVPRDCDDDLMRNTMVRMITVDELKVKAEENLLVRSKEISKCQKIIDFHIMEYFQSQKERQLERALSAVPASIKGIKKRAYSEVFVKELENMDPASRQVLDSMVDYMEKKYISVPMKMAKEILLKESSQQI